MGISHFRGEDMSALKYLRLPQYEAKEYPSGEESKIQALFRLAFGGRVLSSEMIGWQICERLDCIK